MSQRDQLWKAIIEDLFEDFLRFFFPNADDLFDFSRQFEYLDKELEQLFPPGSNNHKILLVDKLVKVYMRDQQEEWVLIHVEPQGYPDKLFTRRMFRYFYRIWDKYDKRIAAIAIFTDGRSTYHPTFFETSFLGTSVRYQFNSYKIMEQPAAELEQSDNPFAQVVLTAQAYLQGKKLHGDALYDFNLALVKNLLTKNMHKEKIRTIMNFLASYVHFENQEMIDKFTEEVECLTTNEKRSMGVMEYLSKRYEEAQEEARKAEEKAMRAEENAFMAEEKARKAQEAARKAQEEAGKAIEKVTEAAKEKASIQTSELTKKLISLGQLNDEQIADIMDVPRAFVENIRKEIGA